MVSDLLVVDARSLRLLQVSLGTLLLVDLWMRARNLRAHYTDAGVFPRAAAIEEVRRRGGRWSLHLLGGSPAFAGLMFVVAAIFALMLLVGYQTRLATVASWLLLVSLHARMPVILNGSDTLLRMLLFWSILLPSGRESSPVRIVSVGSAALLVQVAMVYVVAGWAKLNPVWRQGNGLFYALSHFGSPLGMLLLKWPSVLRAASKAVPWVEIGGALLLFSPIRTPEVRLVVVLFFIGFHAAIGLLMKNLGLFPLTCMAAWAIFIPTFAWDKILWLQGDASPPPVVSSQFVGSLALLLLIYAALGNVDALRRSVFGRRASLVTARLNWIVNAGMLQHNWRFFSSPTNAWAWFVFQMNLEDGRSVDMLSGDPPVFDEESRRLAHRKLVTDHRWWDYFRSLARPGASHIKYALGYYGREWNASHPPGQRITSIVAHMAIQPAYPASRRVMWEKNKCRAE